MKKIIAIFPYFLSLTLMVWLTVMAIHAFHTATKKGSERGGLSTRKAENWSMLSAGRQVDAGDKAAQVEIIEFSDYECPFCRKLEPRLQELISEHPGKIAFYRYDFPQVKLHAHAWMASIASRCAMAQGFSEPFQSMLFRDSSNLSNGGLLQIASDAKIPDQRKFAACVLSHREDAGVRRDSSKALELKINGTPALVINGTIASGLLTIEDLRTLYNGAVGGVAVRH